VASEKLTEVVSIRLTPEDKKFLAKVAAKMSPATMLAVARLALRLGLKQLDKEHRR
jgi:hypothetical protein